MSIPIGMGVGVTLAPRSAGPTRGPELVTNGGFADGTGWTTSASVVIGSGVATFTASASGDNVIQTVAALNVSKFYEVTYDVTSITAGSVSSALGGALGAARAAPGTYSDIIQPLAATAYIRSRLAGTTATIDNISVREVLA